MNIKEFDTLMLITIYKMTTISRDDWCDNGDDDDCDDDDSGGDDDDVDAVGFDGVKCH